MRILPSFLIYTLWRSSLARLIGIFDLVCYDKHLMDIGSLVKVLAIPALVALNDTRQVHDESGIMVAPYRYHCMSAITVEESKLHICSTGTNLSFSYCAP